MSDLAAELTPDQVLEFYRLLRLTRAAEEQLDELAEQGHIPGDVYRSLGQEAGAVGAACALRRAEDGTGDVLAHTVRAAGALFAFGADPIDFFRQYLGRATGPSAGKGSDVQWVDAARGFTGPSSLGTMVEVMAGMTLAFRLRGDDRVGMVFYGDGASSTGAWHEGLNFAAVQRCPMVLMVEANQYAFSSPTSRNTRLESFTEKGPGYGIEAVSVDGTDVLAVYQTVTEAVARARSGSGTQMVELRYFRRLGHSRDDEQEYVLPEHLAEWEARDPIDGLHRRILDQEWATEDQLAAIVAEVTVTCRVAARRALEEAAPAPEEALDGVYSDVDTPRPWTRTATPDPRNAS